MRPIPNLPETTHTVKTRRFSELFELVIVGLIWATETEKLIQNLTDFLLYNPFYYKLKAQHLGNIWSSWELDEKVI